jgi:hypothetical protein
VVQAQSLFEPLAHGRCRAKSISSTAKKVFHDTMNRQIKHGLLTVIFGP